MTGLWFHMADGKLRGKLVSETSPPPQTKILYVVFERPHTHSPPMLHLCGSTVLLRLLSVFGQIS